MEGLFYALWFWWEREERSESTTDSCGNATRSNPSALPGVAGAGAGDSGIFHVAAASATRGSRPTLAFDLVFEQDSGFNAGVELDEPNVQVALAFTRLSRYSSGSSGIEKVYVERVLRVLTARARVASNAGEVVVSCNPVPTSLLLAAKIDAALRGKIAVSFVWGM